MQHRAHITVAKGKTVKGKPIATAQCVVYRNAKPMGQSLLFQTNAHMWVTIHRDINGNPRRRSRTNSALN